MAAPRRCPYGSVNLSWLPVRSQQNPGDAPREIPRILQLDKMISFIKSLILPVLASRADRREVAARSKLLRPSLIT